MVGQFFLAFLDGIDQFAINLEGPRDEFFVAADPLVEQISYSVQGHCGADGMGLYSTTLAEGLSAKKRILAVQVGTHSVNSVSRVADHLRLHDSEVVEHRLEPCVVDDWFLNHYALLYMIIKK